jgi:hypothetical protein
MRKVLVPANAHESDGWSSTVVKQFRDDEGDIIGFYTMLVSFIQRPRYLVFFVLLNPQCSNKCTGTWHDSSLPWSHLLAWNVSERVWT